MFCQAPVLDLLECTIKAACNKLRIIFKYCLTDFYTAIKDEVKCTAVREQNFYSFGRGNVKK